MDIYTIAGLILMLAVMAAIVAAVRYYQKVRVNTGYHSGKFYRRGQHTGAFAGNYQMNKLGVMDGNTDDRVETDEEMYLFSDAEKQQGSENR